jgi:hypothetical protein
MMQQRLLFSNTLSKHVLVVTEVQHSMCA